MNHLQNMLTKLRNAKRNQLSKGTARKRFGNRLYLEKLEERALMAGLVSHWTADNTAVDQMGAHNGTLSGGVTYAAGKVGQAFRLDGINDTVLLAGTFGGGPEATIEAWVKSTGSTGDFQAIVSATESYFVHLQLGLYGNNVAYTNDEVVALPILSPTPTDEYRHIALSVKSGESRLYINGTLAGTSTATYSTLLPTSNLRIGSGYLGSRYFKGEIDEVSYYDQALTASEILSNYNASPAGDPTMSISDVVTIEGDDHFGSNLGDLVTVSGNGGLDRSSGMTIGPDGNLYVGSFNTNEVLRFNGTSGAFMGTFIANGSGGLSEPAVDGLHFRPDGMLYILSRANSNVLRFDASTGSFLNVFIPSGSGGLSSPKGMVFGQDGNLYISSADQVLKYSGTNGAFLGVFVASNSGGLTGARSLAFGPDGNFYVGSTNNYSVLRYNGATGAFLNAIVPSSSGGLAQPGSLLFQNGSLYVASQGTNQILRYESISGQFLDAVDTSNTGYLDRPIGLLLDGTGNLLVGSFDKIVRYGTVQGTSFKVSLSSPRPQTISVNYATANGSALSGSDYTSALGTLTFSPGDTVKSIFVPTLDDSIYEGNETFNVVLSSPVGATIVDNLFIATILDDELPPTKFYVVNDGSPDRTYEYGASGTAVENYSVQATNTAPRGVASNPTGDKVWVVDANKKVFDNNTDRVYQFDAATSRTSGSASPSFSFALSAGNTNPQGIADPPPASKLVGQASKQESTSRDQFIAQVDSIVENWNEDSLFSQTKKRLAGRR